MDAFNARDWSLLTGFFDPDIRMRQPLADAGTSAPSFPGSYTGIGEFITVMGQIAETVDNLQVTVRAIEEGPDGMVIVEMLQSLGPDDAREHQMTWVVDRIEDGLIAASESFASEELARRAFERGI